MKNTNKFKHFHFWHIVTISPWPFLLSTFALSMPIGLVTFFQGYYFGVPVFLIGLFMVIFIMCLWFRDIVIEASYEGHHTKQVQSSLIISFLLFIFSEVMLFVAFFWAFFHSSLFPTVELNCSWPPVGMSDIIMDPFGIPLLNTLLLLTSGATLTLAHLYMKQGFMNKSLLSMVVTLLFAILFLSFQFYEYSVSAFDISDSIYGSTFFCCTGLHGFHVIVGTIGLSMTTLRIYFSHFSRNHHLGFEFAAWYWHFVDVVWLFLYMIIYCWGSDMVSPLILELKDGQENIFYLI